MKHTMAQMAHGFISIRIHNTEFEFRIPNYAELKGYDIETWNAAFGTQAL